MTRIAKKEIEALAAAVEYFENEGLPLFVALKSLLEKLDAKAKHTDEGGLAPAKIENILVMYSAGKVIPVTAARSVFWIKQYQIWRAMGPTEAQVETVARWLGKQGWLSEMTIDQVAYKWPSYMARASVEAGRSQTQARKEFVDE